jgi:large subunit ribosomal protein L17
MRHRVAGRKLNRNSGHRKALYRNLMTGLFRYERIKTTEAKAKAIRGQAEKLITLAKRGDLHARRQVLRVISDKEVVDKLFHVLAPDFEERPGGYTRIIKLGPRQGDAAPMVLLELVR